MLMQMICGRYNNKNQMTKMFFPLFFLFIFFLFFQFFLFPLSLKKKIFFFIEKIRKWQVVIWCHLDTFDKLNKRAAFCTQPFFSICICVQHILITDPLIILLLLTAEELFCVEDIINPIKTAWSYSWSEKKITAHWISRVGFLFTNLKAFC